MSPKSCKKFFFLLITLIILIVTLPSCVTLLTDVATSAVLGYSPSKIDKNMSTLDPDANYSKRASVFLTLMGDEEKMKELESMSITSSIVNAVLSNPRKGIEKITIPCPDHDMIAYLVFPEDIEKLEYPVIIFSHGGGFELWDFSKYEGFCCQLADRTGSVVLFYEYRKAPEFKFPCGVEDTFEAYKWLMDDDNCSMWGLDNKNFILAGDSSGGNFMSGLSIRIAEENMRQPKGVLLLYPSVDVSDNIYYSRLAFGGLEEGAPYFVDDFKYLVSVSNKYLADPKDAYKPYASPLIMLMGLIEADGWNNRFKDYKARLTLPVALPEHFICVPEVDTLRDEGKLYHAVLRILGIKSTLKEYKGMFHGFAMADFAFYQAETCINDCIQFINKVFYGG